MDENRNNDEMENLEDGLVTLLDDEGNEHDFEHLDTFEYNGEAYVVLVPATDDEEADEVLIFKLGTDEDDNEVLLAIEDEEELDEVFEEFKSRMQEEFDFEE